MAVIWFLLPGLFPISYVGHRSVMVVRGVVVAAATDLGLLVAAALVLYQTRN